MSLVTADRKMVSTDLELSSKLDFLHYCTLLGKLRENDPLIAEKNLCQICLDIKPQVKDNAFDDLLSGSGFTATKREEARRKLADLKREAQSANLDPEKVKVHQQNVYLLNRNPSDMILRYFWNLLQVLFLVTKSSNRPSCVQCGLELQVLPVKQKSCWSVGIKLAT